MVLNRTYDFVEFNQAYCMAHDNLTHQDVRCLWF